MDEQRAGLPAENIEPETDDPGEVSWSSPTATPLERVGEYVRQAIAEPDGLVAAVGAVNGRLMEMTLRLSDRLDAILIADEQELLTSERAFPAVNVYLRLHRQIDRYSQLALKFRGVDGKKQPIDN